MNEIVLVEDNAEDATFFVHALEEARLSMRMHIVRDGLEALALIFGDGNPDHAIPRIRPKLIVLDLKLPRVGGIELLSQLRTNLHTRMIPVVILSSSFEKHDLAESYQWGASSYLVKPIDFEKFSETVRILGRYWLQFNRTPRQ